MDLHQVLGWFAAECDATEMRIPVLQSEAMVLDLTKVAWHL